MIECFAKKLRQMEQEFLCSCVEELLRIFQ